MSRKGFAGGCDASTSIAKDAGDDMVCERRDRKVASDTSRQSLSGYSMLGEKMREREGAMDVTFVGISKEGTETNTKK